MTATVQPSASPDVGQPAAISNRKKEGNDWTLENVEVRPTTETPVQKPRNMLSSHLRAHQQETQESVDMPSSSDPSFAPVQDLSGLSSALASEMVTNSPGTQTSATQNQVKLNTLSPSDDFGGQVDLSRAKQVGEKQVDWSDILDKQGQNQLERDTEVDLTTDDFASLKHTEPKLRAHLPQTFTLKKVPATSVQKAPVESPPTPEIAKITPDRPDGPLEDPASKADENALNDQLDAVLSRTRSTPSSRQEEPQPIQRSPVFNMHVSTSAGEPQPMQQSPVYNLDATASANKNTPDIDTASVTMNSGEKDAQEQQMASVPEQDVQPLKVNEDDSGYFDLGDMWKQAKDAARQLRTAAMNGAQNPLEVSESKVASAKFEPAALAPGGFTVTEPNSPMPAEPVSEVTADKDDQVLSEPASGTAAPAESIPTHDVPTELVPPATAYAAPERNFAATAPDAPSTAVEDAEPEIAFRNMAPDPQKIAAEANTQDLAYSISEEVSQVPDPGRFERAVNMMRHTIPAEEASARVASVPIPSGIDEAVVADFLHHDIAQKDVDSQSLKDPEVPSRAFHMSSVAKVAPELPTEATSEITGAAETAGAEKTLIGQMPAQVVAPEAQETIPDKVSDVPDPLRFERAMRHALEGEEDSKSSTPAPFPEIPMDADETIVNNFLHNAGAKKDVQSQSKNTHRVPTPTYVSPVTEAAFSVEELAKLPDTEVTSRPVNPKASPSPDAQDWSEPFSWTNAWNSKVSETYTAPTSSPSSAGGADESSDFNSLRGMLPSKVTVPSLEMAAHSPSEASIPQEQSIMADLGDFWGKSAPAARVMNSASNSIANSPASMKNSATDAQSSEISEPVVHVGPVAYPSPAKVVSDANNFATAAEADVQALDGPDASTPPAPDASTPLAPNVDDWIAVQRMSHSSGASPWIESESIHQASPRIPDRYSDGLPALSMSGSAHSEALNEATSKTQIASWRPVESQATAVREHTSLDDAEVEAKHWVAQFRKKHLSLLALGARTYRSSSAQAKVR
eukprot:gnl/MRDRNA2_/MRDRNA2_36099_c0_seq1.p1 gnl/MRDRNA2_/MRDRNA2_36099_c0~~gnl/MRDRNA2_/MRDRNA2_36099_c0_seq1.p1  ORF type:complete len:1170 (-),score=297.40 gnl/MRDRNA2_/MRDRNA2_36099_c0_seq1:148-3222(-)